MNLRLYEKKKMLVSSSNKSISKALETFTNIVDINQKEFAVLQTAVFGDQHIHPTYMCL